MSREKLLPVMVHVIGWLFIFGLLAGFLYNAHPEQHFIAFLFTPAFLFFASIFLFSYYFNTQVLVPFLYLRKKYLLYAVIVFLMLVAVFFIRPFDRLIGDFNMNPDMPMPQGPAPPGLDEIRGPGPGPAGMRPPGQHNNIFKTDIVSIVLYVMVISLGLALCMIREWRITEQRALKAETEKAHAELSFLKAQINPHFLFNTLNNIYSMVVVKHEHAAEAVMKLSNIMRYITDEIRTDLVPLQSEVSCMEDYVELQRMRLGGKTEVLVQVNGDTTCGQLAPLLLMTFVENAFKYGVSNHEPAPIHIQLDILESGIRFYCRNKSFPVQAHAERAGIGIANARRRLDYLYQGKHKLEINTDDGFYTVQLFLQTPQNSI